MARLKFLGFDLQGNGVPITGSFSAYDYVACDPGVQWCARTSDSLFWFANETTGKILSRVSDLGNASKGACCAGAGFQNFPLNSTYFGGPSQAAVTVLRSSLNNASELWFSFDVGYLFSGNGFIGSSFPSSWARTETRWQVFKFGDLSLRLKSLISPFGTYCPWDVTFTAFNGNTVLGDITVPGFNACANLSWLNIRIRAKLASGTSGAFELLIGGVSASFTGINTVATTPLDEVDRVWFSGGGLQDPNGTPQRTDSFQGSLDNVLIDDSGFPTGRPVVAVIGSGFSDTSITGWTTTIPGTVTSAVLSVDSNRARGTGTGARAILDIPAPTMTTWNSNLLGYQIVPGLLSSLDNVNIKRLKSGVRFGGVDRFGTVTANITPPFSPDRLQNCGTDTIFYNGGTTDFLKADVASTDVVLEVT